MTAPIRLRQRKNSDGINLDVGMETSPEVPTAIICLLPGAGRQAWYRPEVHREAPSFTEERASKLLPGHSTSLPLLHPQHNLLGRGG